jgi:hypothetical protein
MEGNGESEHGYMDPQIRPVHGGHGDGRPASMVTPAQALIHNAPYAAMIALGAAVIWVSLSGTAWGGIAAALYAVYGLVGVLWIMLFVCPYCRFHGTRSCPCGYGRFAAKLVAAKGVDAFAAQFKKHIPVIVPLWFVPPIVGIYRLVLGFSANLLLLVLVFALVGFIVLPLVSRRYGCNDCPQKETCPWMGKRPQADCDRH